MAAAAALPLARSGSAAAAAAGESAQGGRLPGSSLTAGLRVRHSLEGSSQPQKGPWRRAAVTLTRAAAKDVPKQFREENLKEGLNKNFESFPKSMYGLKPSQMDMFMTEDSPISRFAQKVTEENITSKACYGDGLGLWSTKSLQGGKSRLSMSVNMYRGGGGGGYNRPKTSPPDLPSLLLDARICYLGMPIVPAVTELIVAELLWLDYDNPSKPIYLYINSPGTQNQKKESVAFETEAYAIADTMKYVKAKVHTYNCGQALGQAAMLFAIGDLGHRAVQPNATTKLYSPKVSQSGGSATDMWIKAKELDVNTRYYVELLAKGTGKSVEEIAKDIQRPRYFRGQQAIDYGLADVIIPPRGVEMDYKNYEEMLAQSKARRAQLGRRQPAAAGAGR